MKSSIQLSDLCRAHHLRDRESLDKMMDTLTREKAILNTFMSKFLDKFERKMNSDKVDTPIWDLYKTKMREYNQIDGLIRSAQYYLERT